MPERKPRIAFFTPLLPIRSGISDYSEELLPELCALADVDVVIDRGYRPATTEISRQCRILTTDGFLANQRSYDVAIYQVANSYDHHAYMIPCMEACPGILVLHDFCLQYLVLGLTVRVGRFPALVETLRPRWGDQAPALARRIQLGIADPNTYGFSRPLIERSRAVIVHSEAAAAAVRREAPHRKLRVIPMGVPFASGVSTDVRERFGLKAEDFVISSISTQSYTKRLEKVLRAFRTFQRKHSEAKLLIVGGGSIGDKARRYIEREGLEPAVVTTGWVSKSDYDALIGTSDLVVDLRYPSGAETSASLMRAIAAGRPAIVSDQGTFSELPSAFCRKIAVRDGEELELEAALEELHGNAALRTRMSSAAREWAEQHLGLPDAAARYVEFVKEVAGDRACDVAPGPLFGRKWEGRPADALLYKIARVTYLYRNYGLRDTWRRVREEARRGRGDLTAEFSVSGPKP